MSKSITFIKGRFCKILNWGQHFWLKNQTSSKKFCVFVFLYFVFNNRLWIFQFWSNSNLNYIINADHKADSSSFEYLQNFLESYPETGDKFCDIFQFINDNIYIIQIILDKNVSNKLNNDLNGLSETNFVKIYFINWKNR